MPTADLDTPDDRYHDGAVVPDDWTPVTVGGADIGRTCVALYIGTGGASFTADTLFGTARVFSNPASGAIIPGRFLRVTAATGVSNILAGVVI